MNELLDHEFLLQISDLILSLPPEKKKHLLLSLACPHTDTHPHLEELDVLPHDVAEALIDQEAVQVVEPRKVEADVLRFDRHGTQSYG